MQKILWVTKFVLEINWIKCKFVAILKSHETLYQLTVSDICSFILLGNIHTVHVHFLRLKFAFSNFQETVGRHFNSLHYV